MLTLKTSHIISRTVGWDGTKRVASSVAERVTSIRTPLSSDEVWEIMEAIQTNFDGLKKILERHSKNGKGIEFDCLPHEAMRIVISDYHNLPATHQMLLRKVIRNLPAVLNHTIS